MRTVSPETGAAQAASSRAHALTAHAEELAGDPGASDAVALGLVDATLAGDGEALRAALAALRAVPGEAGEGLAAGAQWALERLPGDGEAAPVAHGTHASGFLRALEAGPLGGTQVREALGTDETQVSRLGR